ncbi:MAG TPA: hypothetical protein VMU99_09845 [Acidimicrobiales bacterium]|nr:hypothetical protein [Acidimicrobiales bacterium]
MADALAHDLGTQTRTGHGAADLVFVPTLARGEAGMLSRGDRSDPIQHH